MDQDTQATRLNAQANYSDDDTVQLCGAGCDLIYPLGMLDAYGCCAACVAEGERTERDQDTWAAEMDGRDYLGDNDDA